MYLMKINFFTLLFIWSFVCPLQAQDLMETYQLAVKNDPQLKKAIYTQSSVGEIKSQSIAQMLPVISVSGNSSRDRINNKKATFQGNGVQNYWNHGFSINLSQPVFHWDHWVQLSQSNNRIAQAEADHEAEHQNLIVRTTEGYFNILAAEDSLAFVLAEKKAIKKQLGLAQQRFEVGLIAITDVYEAQARYAQAQANQIEAENNLYDSKEALAEIIGESNVYIRPLSRMLNFIPPEPDDLTKWGKVSELNNFKIIAALNQAEVNRKNILIQQSGHLPTIDIIANYNVQDVNSTFGLRGETQSIGLQINIPIFQGGGVLSRSKQAEYDYRVAKQELLKIKRRVKRELRNAFRNVTTDLMRVQALKAAVTAAEKAVQATEAGFEVGTRTMADVLAEQKNFYQAKKNYSRSQYDYLINGIKLKQAAGSLSVQDVQVINQYL